MRILIFILFLPFILLIAIPLGGVLLGIGAAIFGIIVGIFGAIFGVIAAIFAAIFGGILSLGGIATGLIFSKAFLIVILVLVIYSLFNRNSASNKVTKQ
jgi:Na+-driven multidrug efflux pump